MFVLGLLLGLGPVAHAHTLGASQLSIKTSNEQIEVRWDIAVIDLYQVLELDTDADGNVTASELDAAGPLIARDVLPQLHVSRGRSECSLQLMDRLVEERLEGFYSVQKIVGQCSHQGPVAVNYQFLFDEDRSHRVVLSVQEGKHQSSAVLTPDARTWESEHASAFYTFLSFIAQGVHHIWIGYDHIAFLVLLLLPSVLRAGREGWEGATRFREVAWRILGIVTAFTAAHSITLSLATLGIVTLPVRPVEIAIAASVVLAGLVNLYPRLAMRAATIAFAFGLVHGFGFANVLVDLGLRKGSLAASLAGFNVGVELGQLAIVAVLLPVIFHLRSATFYGKRFVPAASLATAVVALGWLLERAS